MKRPKTYRASELWDENQAEQMTAECPMPHLIRRRRGRPPTATAQAEWAKALRLVQMAVNSGATEEQIARALGLPACAVQPYLVEIATDPPPGVDPSPERYLRQLEGFRQC